MKIICLLDTTIGGPSINQSLEILISKRITIYFLSCYSGDARKMVKTEKIRVL
jgi:hypothetical protein